MGCSTSHPDIVIKSASNIKDEDNDKNSNERNVNEEEEREKNESQNKSVPENKPEIPAPQDNKEEEKISHNSIEARQSEHREERPTPVRGKKPQSEKEEEEDKKENKENKEEKREEPEEEKREEEEKKENREQEEENKENREQEEENRENRKQEEEEPEEEEKVKKPKKKKKASKKSENESDEEDDIEKGLKIEDWKGAKDKIMQICKRAMIDSNEFELFKLSIKSIYSLTKTDYSKYKLKKNYEVSLIKNKKVIPWMKKPYSDIKNKITSELMKEKTLQKYDKFDWNGKTIFPYEQFATKIKMLKLSSSNKDLEHFTFSFEQIQKPILFLIFSFSDENAITLFKETLVHHSKNKDKYDFMPVYGEILQSANNSLYNWELAEKLQIIHDELEMYFVEDQRMNMLFNYLTDDNVQKVQSKVVIIDSNKMIRGYMNPSEFNFAQIENLENSKDDYNKIKDGLIDFVKSEKLSNTPFACDLKLSRTKIYNFDRPRDGFLPESTYYENLSGIVNSFNFKKNNKVIESLKEKTEFIPREPKENFKMDFKSKNSIITKEVEAFLVGVDLKGVDYTAITQKNRVYLDQAKNREKKFTPMRTQNFKMEFHLSNELFEGQFQMAITNQMVCLSQYSPFNNIEYMLAVPKINSIFPDGLNLIDAKTKKERRFAFNKKKDSPGIIIIFSPKSKELFCYSELSIRFNNIYKKIKNYLDQIHVALIFRGSVDAYDSLTDNFIDEDLFNEGIPVHILDPDTNNIFPLYYMNNDIEKSDSQFITFITDKDNKIIYIGNCEDVNLKETFNNMIEEEEDPLTYNKAYGLSHADFKEKIMPLCENFENVLRDELQDLEYKPFYSVSYNCYSFFSDTTSKDEKFVNHIRIRILIKDKDKDIMKENAEIKKIRKALNSYGVCVVIVPVETCSIPIGKNCSKCGEDLDESGYFYEQDGSHYYCVECEKNIDYSQFQNYLIYTKGNSTDEIIKSYFDDNISSGALIDPLLGVNCKICGGSFGKNIYLNMTNFNLVNESPFTQIDICSDCFDVINKKEHFDKWEKDTKFNQLGLSKQNVVYRKIILNMNF